MAEEVWAQDFGQGENDMAMGHREQDMIDDVCRSALNFALMAGWTEQTAFAGEGEQVLVRAVVAPDAGEAAFECAAVNELLEDVGDDWPEGTVLGFVRIRIGGYEGAVVPLDTLPAGLRDTRVFPV